MSAQSPQITLNADMGEGIGLHEFGNDLALMPYLDKANIACGFHAGDPSIMLKTVQLAKQHQVGVGAHPGFPDLVGFGRRTMSMTKDEVRDIILYQVGALQGFLQYEGLELSHIKPHGALYGLLSKDSELMAAVASVCARFEVPFYGLAGTAHEECSNKAGVEFIGELYVDLDYDDSGALIIKRNAGRPSSEQVAQRLRQALASNTIQSESGTTIAVNFQSVCIHSDGPNSVDIARTCSEILGQFSNSERQQDDSE